MLPALPHRNTIEPLARVAARFRLFPPKVWIYVAMKLRLDPMFRPIGRGVEERGQLEALVGACWPTRATGVPGATAWGPCRVVDVGCGYGLALAWLLETRGTAETSGVQWIGAVEPDRHRFQVAQAVIGNLGKVYCSAAPELPFEAHSADLALLIDVTHYLDDRALEATLRRIYDTLVDGGYLLLRDTVPTSRRVSWERRIETWLMQWRGQNPHFRDESKLTGMLAGAGFFLQRQATPGREETWWVARKGSPGEPTQKS